jgi:hypothetical protein
MLVMASRKRLSVTVIVHKGTKDFGTAQYHEVVIFCPKAAFLALFLSYCIKKIMKQLITAIALLVSIGAAAQIQPAAAGVSYGAKTSARGAVSVDKLEAKMATAETFKGKVKGVITSVCEKKGCWMKLKQANGEGIMVRFKDYGFFMPQNIVGKEVVLSGVAQVTTTSVEDLKHYAEDAGKSQEEIAKINAPKKAIEFTAKGVLVL